MCIKGSGNDGLNRDFLYESFKSTIGILDDHNQIDWFLDNSREGLIKKFRGCSIDELVIELVYIFRKGNPNCTELPALFGFDEMEEREIIEGNIKILNIYKIKRINKDISKIEIHRDTNSIIRKLYLYIHELPLQLLKDKLHETYQDISYGTGDGLVICEKECAIFILKTYDN